MPRNQFGHLNALISRIIEDIALVQTTESAFYSEASLQMALGIELFKRTGITPTLEKKIPGTSEYLDIYFPHKGKNLGLELKYKTRATKKLGFEYLNQGAQNHGRYDLLRDVSRLESFKSKKAIDHGLAVLVTNDPSYMATVRATSKVAPFALAEKRIITGAFSPTWKGRTKGFVLNAKYPVRWIKSKRHIGPTQEGFFALLFVV